MRRATLALALVAALCGCATYTVERDWDLAADLAGLRTYDWYEPATSDGAPPAGNELVVRRAVEAVDQVLGARGYRLDAQDPDLRLAVHYGTERSLRITDWGYDYGYRWSALGTRRLDVDEVEEGVLVVDVVLAATGDLVWRGTARGAIDRGSDPAARAARVREVVEAVLAGFPPDGGAGEGRSGDG